MTVGEFGKYLGQTRAGNRWLAGALLAAAAVLATLGAAFRWSPRFPACPIRQATGWRCPACGGTRMLTALLRGDLAGAWYYHPIFLLLIGLAIGSLFWLFLRTFRKNWRPPCLHVQSRWWLLLPAAVLVFWLVRNTGWYRLWFY